MKINAQTSAYLELHIAVILFGFTAILGDLIELSAVMIVWWRVLITCLSLFLIVNVWRTIKKLSRVKILIFSGIGILVGLHWICFYGAIKLSNASITLICMATTSFFTAIMEPLIMKQKFRKLDLGIGIVIIPTMAYIAQSTDSGFYLGIVVGILSAMLASLFATLNKKYISDADPASITFLELGSAWIFISLTLPFYFMIYPETVFMSTELMDWIYIIILALLCTTLAYILALRALKYLSAFASNLVVNLEPVYGGILAIVILKEHKELNASFYIGSSIILAIVIIYPLIRKRISKS